MSTMSEYQKNDLKLAQYHILHCGSDTNNNAKRIFFEEFNINYQYSATKDKALIGCTALHMAADKNRLIDIEFLLSRGANFMIKNHVGCTPIHYAIKENCGPLSHFHKSKPSCMSLLSAQVSSGNMENPKDENGLSHFHIACMVDHAEAIEFFLKSGISVDETTNMDSESFPGYTPLHLAAKHSAVQAIKLLVSYGANMQLKDAKGMSFWCTLVQLRIEINHRCSTPYNEPYNHYSDSEEHDNLQILNFLLQSDIAIEYAGLTKFLVACSGTEVSIAERFLDKVTDINEAVDFEAPRWAGCTALHLAAYSRIEMVKMLVKNGANILAKNAEGVKPLDICIDRYEVEDIHAALSLDANWTSILMSDRKTRLLSLVFAMKDTKQFHEFIDSRPQLVNTIVPLDSQFWQGYTPLHLAVIFYGDNGTYGTKLLRTDDRAKHIMDQLMTKGANINAQDARGMTPLHLACRYKPFVAGFLLKYRDHLVNVVDDENLSHLHIACSSGDVLAVRKILETCIDVDLTFNGPKMHSITVGSTPLHCVASNEEIMDLLLERGANLYAKDVNGMTAIHHSIGMSDALLFSADLRDSVVPDTGVSHLHLAVLHRHLDAVKILLDNGADVNQALLKAEVLAWEGFPEEVENKPGDTPLDLALYNSEMDIVEMLVRRGAEMRVKEPFDFERGDSQILRPLISTLNHDDNVFVRLEEEIGLTMLHVACSRRDVDLIKALLQSGANVNARIDVRSRLWPGYTPLHVVVDNPDPENSLNEIVRLLLDNGADVSLTTCDEGETPLYLAYQRTRKDSASNRYSCMKMLLRAHQDFTVNPIKPTCLSYFHIASTIGEIETVSHFLQYGGADVNEPTDLFRSSHPKTCRVTGGATALLLAAASSEHAMDPMSQLQMVDLLLNNEADVDARDVHGNTALHLVAQWNHRRRDVMLRLMRSNANPNLKNIDDETPLETWLTASKDHSHVNLVRKINVDATVDDVKFFLELGCCFNVFNRTTEKGLIALTSSFMPFDNLLYVIKSSMLTFPRLMQTDEKGRTVMHNVVSNVNGFVKNEPVLSNENYVTLIEELGKFGLDVDVQDVLGITPLHRAVLFRNVEAISGLLMAGADVNLVDASGKTAFSYLFDTCVRFLEKENFLTFGSHAQNDHLNIFSTFMIHMKKLLLCGLDVNLTNQNLMSKAVEKCNSEGMSVREDFGIHINELRGLNIPQSRLKLGSFLSETDAIHAYASLPETDRNAVDEFFKYNVNDLRTRYSHVASILLLQYRKAVKRLELNRPAQFALGILARMHLPVLCSDAILKLLSNSELVSMIETVA